MSVTFTDLFCGAGGSSLGAEMAGGELRLGLNHWQRADRWVFGNKLSGTYLYKLSWTPIERHTLVKGAASPDDPALKDYWAKRRRRNGKYLPPQKRRLAHAQKGQCSHCQTSLFNGEDLHLHHLKGKGEPDSEELHNLRLVHLYCHQQIHAKRRKSLDAKRLA